MRRIAILNQKGGVGKTTSAVNLARALARQDRRVLAVDLDPQSHLSLHFGLDPRSDRPNMYHLLTDGATLAECRTSLDDKLHVVGSHIDLAAAEMELASVVGREVLLRDALRDCPDRYEFVILDCPPSLGILTLNGLCAANEVLVPLQPHFLALQGLGKLLETVRLVATRLNRSLTVTGVLLCLYDSGTRLAAEVVEDLRDFLAGSRSQDVPWKDAALFRTMIRRNIRLAECPSHGRTIFEYAPSSNGAKDYAALAEEILADAGSETAPSLGKNSGSSSVYRDPAPSTAGGPAGRSIVHSA